MSEPQTISARVQVGYDPIYAETDRRVQFEEQLGYFYYPLLKTHMGWAIMLAEKGIIPKRSAAELCKALTSLQGEKPDILRPFIPKHSDVYVHTEKLLVKMIGEEHVGHLALARTRPEPIPRMVLRERLLNAIDMSLTMRRQMLDTAERNLDAVMPGYTHSQPAQPTTFAHYLMGGYDPIAEDGRFLVDAYDNVNRSTMGCGALAGTGFKIDRYRFAELLGFDGIIENTYQSVSSNDYHVVSANATENSMVTISRMAQDLNEWCAYEVRMLLTAPQFSDYSSMMPQKYNPGSLENIRYHSAYGVAMAHNVSSILMKSHYADVREYDRCWVPVFQAVDNAAATMRLFGAVIETMIVYKERMLELARRDFSSCSELADEIYRRTGMHYRISHAIVANVVNEAMEKHITALDVTPEMVDRAAVKVTGNPLGWSQEEILQCLDPVHFVNNHDLVGGPAPSEVARMIADRRAKLAAEVEAQEARKARLAEGDRKLESAAADMIAAGAA